MHRQINTLCALVAAVTLLDSGAACGGDNVDAARADAKLADVRSRIAALTSRLSGELEDRDALSARLREADLNLTAERRRADGLRADRLAAERQRAQLQSAATRARQALDAERAALGAQVRAAYQAGRQEPLKLLLNQSDPASAGRLLALYGYFARTRADRIDAIRMQAEKIHGLVAQIDRATARLQTMQGDMVRELTLLQTTRKEQAAALAAVAAHLSGGNQELARLKREEQAEEALLAELAQVLPDLPLTTQQSFEQSRGKLPWPVPGRMSAKDPGGRRGVAPSGLRRNGMLIDSVRGAKVRAPYVGRVVYADWLQGLGLLLIIAHSGNYMTLYGHAEVLYKSVGDWVAPGDVIAALGDGATPQLYFEIREGRKAVDPKLWLRAAP